MEWLATYSKMGFKMSDSAGDLVFAALKEEPAFRESSLPREEYATVFQIKTAMSSDGMLAPGKNRSWPPR